MNLQITAADGTVTIHPLTFTGGLSEPVRIPGTPLDLLVAQATPAGTAWTLAHTNVPTGDVGDVAARLATIGEPNLVRLFGVDPAEPYRTWKALWESDRPLPYRLGALVLAVAARIAEIRRKGAPGA